MNDIRAIRAEIIAHTAAVRAATATLGLSVPSVWGIEQLKAHYPAWSEERILREFRMRFGLSRGRGKGVEINVSTVREMDARLAAEALKATA